MKRSAFYVTCALLLMMIGPWTTMGQQIVVAPYLQDATPTSIHILWETSQGGDCKVKWGTTRALTNESGRVFSMINERPSQIHRTPLEALEPSTKYFYQVTTGEATSDVYHFITPPLPGEEQSFQFVAMSDMQRDDERPKQFKEVIEKGVITYVAKNHGEDLSEALSMVIIPGDLTKDGDVYTDWTEDFFGQSTQLLPYVPLYPVLGNHERNSDYYFNYFHLPDNGTPGYMEHWYYKDYGNMRIIGLNSNENYLVQEQLDWLEEVLDDAEDNDHIDFVFAQLHHPYKSELWIDGERDYTGEVIFQLEKFSTRTGKPTIHFYGHTHGYSRGQSRDHNHLWVNVATAGGRIDGWGEYAQSNYDEFSRSDSDYGFVLMQVESGDDPKFKLVRVSQGDVPNPKDNEITDVIEIKRYASPPATPRCIAPVKEAKVRPDQVVLQVHDFESADGSEHGQTQWQVGRAHNLTNPDVDAWRHYEDWYGGEDLNQGIDLTELQVPRLEPGTTYYWRVRYRTKGLVWSDWSEVQKFTTK
ncbi:MAG: fibronectin type III domain-containing protein [Bacteroidota bacterium]